jgi:hypothetical protein
MEECGTFEVLAGFEVGGRVGWDEGSKDGWVEKGSWERGESKV